MRLVLPWPPSVLTPNARIHHMALHRAKKTYARMCQGLALEAGLHLYSWPDEIPMRITLCDPTGRVKRDDDNAKAAFKAGRDAVAKAMRVDDARWKPEYAEGEPIKGGQIIIEFLTVLVPVRGSIRCGGGR